MGHDSSETRGACSKMNERNIERRENKWVMHAMHAIYNKLIRLKHDYGWM